MDNSPKGGKLVLQLVNFEKYFAQQQGDYLGNLPLIVNDKVKFERFYYLNEEGKIAFQDYFGRYHRK